MMLGRWMVGGDFLFSEVKIGMRYGEGECDFLFLFLFFLL